MTDTMQRRTVNIRGANQNNDEVDAKSQAWQRQRKAWDLISDLRSGTARMREVGRKWLPQEEAEDRKTYSSRRDRSTLYGVLDDTVKNLTSKPFSKPVSVNGDLPEQLQDIEDDVDRTGRSLTQFGSDVMSSAIEHGMAGIWVDFPKTAGAISNLAEERRSGVRPTFHLVKAHNVLGYGSFVNVETGKQDLTEIRMLESITEKDGEFAWFYRSGEYALHLESAEFLTEHAVVQKLELH